MIPLETTATLYGLGGVVAITIAWSAGVWAGKRWIHFRSRAPRRRR